jgi:hypothetical protein
LDDILSAVTQLESSKPGCASGDSSWCFQLVRSGRVIACAVPIVPVRPPSGSLAPAVVTAWPSHVTFVAPVKTSMFGLSALSPERFSVPSEPSVAPRNRCVPRTMTWPEPVLCCQNVSAVGLSPISSSSGLSPGPLTAMRSRPVCE